jgi:hypothetical protein
MRCSLFVIITILLVIFPIFAVFFTHNLLNANGEFASEKIGSGVVARGNNQSKEWTSHVQNQNTESSEIIIPKIRQYISVASDIVYQGRLSRDSNYSLASTYPTYPTIRYLSRYDANYNKKGFNSYTPGVPLIAWSRKDSRLFFKRAKSGAIVTTQDLGQDMKSIIHSGYSNIKAIRYVLGHRLCYLLNHAGSLDELPVPAVFTTRFDENSGFMASDIPGRTCMAYNYERSNHTCREFGSMEKMLADCGRTFDDMKAYLNHEKILLLVTTQQQSFEHDKVISFPLGIRPHVAIVAAKVLSALGSNQSLTVKRRLLAVNFNTRYFRERLMHHYRALYGETNGYISETDNADEARQNYLLYVASSKFVLCPAGLGADTYRMWEALTMGAFPIVETTPGLDKLFSYLPVLVVQDIFEVSKELLEEAYECFMRHAGEWKYELLTQPYWDYVILRAMDTGSIQHIIDNHPQRNPYCDFLNKSKF